MSYLKTKDIKRGQVYWVNLDPVIGSEIRKTRPAMIISNNIQNRVSSRVVILPITSNIDKLFPFEAKINLENKQAKVLADQIRTIDKTRLRDYISTLTKIEMKDIEKATKITLSLE